MEATLLLCSLLVKIEIKNSDGVLGGRKEGRFPVAQDPISKPLSDIHAKVIQSNSRHGAASICIGHLAIDIHVIVLTLNTPAGVGIVYTHCTYSSRPLLPRSGTPATLVQIRNYGLPFQAI